MLSELEFKMVVVLRVTNSSIDKLKFVLGREAKTYRPTIGCDSKMKGKR